MKGCARRASSEGRCESHPAHKNGTPLQASEEVGVAPSSKSRWCIRGDKDPDILELERFSPTVSTSSLQIAMQAAMNHGFRGRVGDLKSAFTQSMPLMRKKGRIFCTQCGGGHHELQDGQLIEVVLGVYGLPDAPLHWRRTLKNYLVRELGYKPARMDPCLFLMHGNGDVDALEGMILVEVDDLLMFGGSRHDQKMARLQERFKFGKLKDINEEGVGFNGRRLSMVNGVLYINMEKFVKERLMEAEITKERKKQTGEKLNSEELGQTRAICGALNWAGKEGRPDAAAAASLYASRLRELTVAELLEMNKVVKSLKERADLKIQI